MAQPFSDTIFETLNPCNYKVVRDEICLDCLRCQALICNISQLRKQVKDLEHSNNHLEVTLAVEQKKRLSDTRDFEVMLKLNRAHCRQLKEQHNQMVTILLPKIEKILPS